MVATSILLLNNLVGDHGIAIFHPYGSYLGLRLAGQKQLIKVHPTGLLDREGLVAFIIDIVYQTNRRQTLRSLVSLWVTGAGQLKSKDYRCNVKNIPIATYSHTGNDIRAFRNQKVIYLWVNILDSRSLR